MRLNCKCHRCLAYTLPCVRVLAINEGKIAVEDIGYYWTSQFAIGAMDNTFLPRKASAIELGMFYTVIILFYTVIYFSINSIVCIF